MNELVQFIAKHGYALLFGWIFAEQMGIPLPAIPMLLGVGALAGEGVMHLHWSLAVAILATLASNIFLYLIGRHKGSSVLSLLCQISLNPESCVRRTADLFSRYGPRSLLVAKFVPGFNIMSSPLAGIFRMNPFTFLLYDGLGTSVWVGVFAGLGYLFREQIEDVANYALRMGAFLLVILIGGLAGFIIVRYIQRRRFINQFLMARITPEELNKKLEVGEEVVILDVRHPLELSADPQIIPGAFYIPMERLNERQHEIPRGREIIVYCN